MLIGVLPGLANDFGQPANDFARCSGEQFLYCHIGSQLLNARRVRWVGVNRSRKLRYFQVLFYRYDQLTEGFPSSCGNNRCPENGPITFCHEPDEALSIVLTHRPVNLAHLRVADLYVVPELGPRLLFGGPDLSDFRVGESNPRYQICET